MEGGEATLVGLEFFRRSIELVDRYLPPGQRAADAIQANGIKRDAEWAALLRPHEFLVGISIDGPRDVHDMFRVARGADSWCARSMWTYRSRDGTQT